MGALVDLEDVAGKLADPLGDPPAVERAHLERAEDQEVHSGRAQGGVRGRPRPETPFLSPFRKLIVEKEAS